MRKMGFCKHGLFCFFFWKSLTHFEWICVCSFCKMFVVHLSVKMFAKADWAITICEKWCSWWSICKKCLIQNMKTTNKIWSFFFISVMVFCLVYGFAILPICFGDKCICFSLYSLCLCVCVVNEFCKKMSVLFLFLFLIHSYWWMLWYLRIAGFFNW